MNQRTSLILIVAAAIGAAAPSLARAAGPAAPRLARAEGEVRSYPDGRVDIYRIELGDAESAMRRAEGEAQGRFIGIYSAFANNAAQYVHKADGSWMVRDFRRPTLAQRDEFARYEDRPAAPGKPDFRSFLLDQFSYDFGEPGEWVYQRLSIPQADLPAPFSRVSAQALEPVQMIMKYHDNDSVVIFLNAPYDEDGHVQGVLQRLSDELRAAR